MFAKIRASRPTMFLWASLASMAVCVIASVVLWNEWPLARLCSSMGIPSSPVLLGMAISLIPIYFISIEIWIPGKPMSGVGAKDEVSEGNAHWNAVRLTALLCILVTELICQMIPDSPGHVHAMAREPDHAQPR